MALIEYTRRGSGRPPLVFVHGFGCARSDWDDVVAHFGERHETVAVDLGGHGASKGTDAHRRIETHGADVAELLRTLALSPAVLFGHSMGCRVAMEAALAAPDCVKAVVLVDGSRLGEKGSTSYLERGRLLATMGYDAFVRVAFEQMFHPAYDRARARDIIERAAARDPDIAGPLFVDIGRYDSETLDRVVASLDVPLMAIQTTYTEPGGKRVSLAAGQTSPYLEFLRRSKTGVRIEVIPDTGHFPQLEKPRETNTIIESFLKGLSK